MVAWHDEVDRDGSRVLSPTMDGFSKASPTGDGVFDGLYGEDRVRKGRWSTNSSVDHG